MPLLGAVDSVNIDNLVIPFLDISCAFIKSHQGAKDAPPTDNDNSIISNLLVRFEFELHPHTDLQSHPDFSRF